MPFYIDLPTFSDQRGHLTVIERELPFQIKRIFYIYGVDDSVRARHRHHKTIMGLIPLNGSCILFNNDGKTKQEFVLNRPDQCLIVEPKDWHEMHSFTPGTVLLVLASEYFDKEDYIYEPYPT